MRLIIRLLYYSLIILAGSFLLLQIDRWGEERYQGTFRVVDGDTLRLGDLRFRLLGFDAPELKQRCGEESDSWPCGEAAKQALQHLVDQKGFHCRGSSKDRYARLLVFCFVGEVDVGETMVASGMAVATQKILYQKQQLAAKSEKVGLWSGPFDRPGDWRKMNRRADMDLPLLALLMVVRRSIGW